MVYLSFDIEEFDVPLERDNHYDVLSRGIEISRFGTLKILELLHEEQICATFFCTTNFASRESSLIKTIINEGHEIASHGCSHFNLHPTDPEVSKCMLEDVFDIRLLGYRQPKMQGVNLDYLKKCGYEYSASLNPTFIPGRYFNLFCRRKPYFEDGIYVIPASVTPITRIPLFWASMHFFPLFFYKLLCFWTIIVDKSINLYFHPWEFYPMNIDNMITVPFLIKHNSGEEALRRLKSIIMMFKSKGERFGTYSEYVKQIAYNK